MSESKKQQAVKGTKKIIYLGHVCVCMFAYTFTYKGSLCACIVDIINISAEIVLDIAKAMPQFRLHCVRNFTLHCFFPFSTI